MFKNWKLVLVTRTLPMPCLRVAGYRMCSYVFPMEGSKDGFGSDTDEIGSECHLLPHFKPDTNVNADLVGYEYKTNSSNPDSNPDTFST